MTKRTPSTKPSDQDVQDRKVKLAEGGIILGLIVALCVFLGIRFAHDDDTTVTQRLPRADTAPEVVATEPAPVVASTPAPAAAVGTEPAAVVEQDLATSVPVDDPLPLADRLPAEVPIMVTYATSEAAFHAGHYDEAATMFAAYCDEHPGNAWGHYMRGLSLWKADRDQEAESAFQDALVAKADHLKSLINLARVQLELEQTDAALATIERALDVSPQSVDARRVLGRVYHEQGRLDEAAATYEEALARRSDDAWTLNNLALVWIEQDRFTQALPALARASELAPEVAVIRNNLGTALEGNGHLAQARDQFELAADAGSARGEQSFLRLEAVTMPADVQPVDLAALAASWSLDEPTLDPVQPAPEEVAAISPAHLEAGDDR